jgi:hypothetical protein
MSNSQQIPSPQIDDFFFEGDYRKQVLLDHLKDKMPEYERYCTINKHDPKILEELLKLENWIVEFSETQSDGTLKTALSNTKVENSSGWIFEKHKVVTYISIQVLEG